MNQTMTRILTTLSALLLLYLGVVIVASVVQLADAADRIYLGSGQLVFWILLTFFALLLITPVFLYFTLPQPLIPPVDGSGPAHDEFMTELRLRMRRNPRLQGVTLSTNEDIPGALSMLAQDADKIIRDTASVVFVGTAVMQNGRLDGLIVLATQFRMVWRIASIYHQRPSPREMLYLYSNVGAAALLAENIQEIQFSELATPLVASIFPSLKGAIPGLQGIAALMVNSIANGSANAFLTLRVGIVARTYCESLVKPSRQAVRQSATVAALALVAKIAKDNGTRVVEAAWTSVGGIVGGAVDSTVQSAKKATGKVVDTTVNTAKTVGDSISSASRDIKNAAGRLTSGREPNK